MIDIIKFRQPIKLSPNQKPSPLLKLRTQAHSNKLIFAAIAIFIFFYLLYGQAFTSSEIWDQQQGLGLIGNTYCHRLLQKNQSASNGLSFSSIIQIIMIVVAIVVSTIVIIVLICFIDHFCFAPRPMLITNSALNVDKYCPSISYQLFKKIIGEPLHHNCVICLQEFERLDVQLLAQQHVQLEEQQISQTRQQQSMNEDNAYLRKKQNERNLRSRSEEKVSTIESRLKNYGQINNEDQLQVSGKKIQKIGNYQGEGQSKNTLKTFKDVENLIEVGKHENSQAHVKFTICGHLFHAKCLKQWLNRQQNCPICRQVVNEQNILNWMRNFEIKIQELHKLCFQQPKKEKTNIFDRCFNRNGIMSQEEILRELKIKNLQESLTQIIVKSNEKNMMAKNQNYQDHIVHQNHYQTYEKLTKSEIYALQIYSKIMHYHKLKSIKKEINQNVKDAENNPNRENVSNTQSILYMEERQIRQDPQDLQEGEDLEGGTRRTFNRKVLPQLSISRVQQ